jgi:hypothetical protein
MKRTFAAVLLTCTCSQRAYAQQAASGEDVGRVATAADSVPRTIAEAEARARRMILPSPADTLPLQNGFPTTTGSAERRCAEVGGAQYVRSGDFVVGPFTSYSQNWYSGYGKLAVVPVHGSKDSPRAMTLTATKVGTGGEARIFAESLQHGMWYFYPSNFHLPSTGRWLLITSTPDTWGCFVFDLQ